MRKNGKYKVRVRVRRAVKCVCVRKTWCVKRTGKVKVGRTGVWERQNWGGNDETCRGTWVGTNWVGEGRCGETQRAGVGVFGTQRRVRGR